MFSVLWLYLNRPWTADETLVWWVNLGWLPAAHQATVSFLFNRTGGKNKIKKLIGWDKNREITYQLLSWAKQIRLVEDKFNLLLIKNRVGWWKTKTKLKPPSIEPPFFPGSTSFLHFWHFYLHPTPAAQENGQLGLWSAHNTSSPSLFPPFAVSLPQSEVPPRGSSSSGIAPAWGPYHRVQSFSKRLLQSESPACQNSCQKTCSCRGSSPWAAASFRAYPPLWHRIPYRLQGGCLLHRGPPWPAGGQPASPQSSPQAVGESLLQCLEHLTPPSPPSLTLVSAGLFSHSSPPQLLPSVFYPFLINISEKCQ